MTQWQYLDTNLITACVSDEKKNPLSIMGQSQLSSSLKEIYSAVS